MHFKFGEDVTFDTCDWESKFEVERSIVFVHIFVKNGSIFIKLRP